MEGLLGGLAGWVIGVVQAVGYPGLAVLLVLENIFPPIPSELILPLAGFMAAQGQLALQWAWAAATVGSVIGALLLYALGRGLGEERLRELIGRYGKWLLLEACDVERADEWFDRHGNKAVLLCRLAPMARSMISVPAGLRRMPLWCFVLYTTIGSGLWNAALIGAGWVLGDQWQRVEQYAKWFGYVVLAVLAIAIARFVWQRLSGRRSAQRGAES